jgi:hypothetical protein
MRIETGTIRHTCPEHKYAMVSTSWGKALTETAEHTLQWRKLHCAIEEGPRRHPNDVA